MGQFDELRKKVTSGINTELGKRFESVSDAPIEAATTERPARIKPRGGKPGYQVQERFPTPNDTNTLSGTVEGQAPAAPVVDAATIAKYPTQRARRRGDKARAMMAKTANPTVVGPTPDFESIRAAVQSGISRQLADAASKGITGQSVEAERISKIEANKKRIRESIATETSPADSAKRSQEIENEIRRKLEAERGPIKMGKISKGEDEDNPGYSASDATVGVKARTDEEDAESGDTVPKTKGPKEGKPDLSGSPFRKNTDKLQAASDDLLRKQALEVEQKNRPKGKGPRVVDLNKKATSEKAGDTISSKNLSSVATDADIYEADGSLKPDYDLDKTDRPELTTTIREVLEKPGTNLKAKYGKRLAGYAKEGIDDKVSDTNADLGDKSTYEAGTEIKEANLNVGKQMRRVYVEGGGITKAPYRKPEVQQSGTVVPIRALNQAGPETDPQSLEEVEVGRDSDVKREKALRNFRGARPGTRIADLNLTPTRATVGQTPEQVAVATAKLGQRRSEMGEEWNDTRYDEATMRRAKAIGVRENIITEPRHLEAAYMTGPSMRPHVQKAYVLGQVGMPDDASEEKFDSIPGHARNTPTAQKNISIMHDALRNEERHARTKTYTFDSGKEVSSDPNLGEAHFQDSSGKYVPMSDTSHPENPLKGGNTLTGSEAPLKVITPGSKGVVQEIHEGFSPSTVVHPETGKRIRLFKKTSVPQGSTSLAHISREAVANGESITSALKAISEGRETGMTLPSGEGITAAPKAPINRGSRGRHAEIANEIADTFSKKLKPEEMIGFDPEISKKITEENTDLAVKLSAPKVTGPTPEPTKDSEDARLGRIKNQGDRLPIRETEGKLQSAVRGESKAAAAATSKKAKAKAAGAETPLLQAGQKVFHPKHGVGTVVSHAKTLGTGSNDTTAVVNFSASGTKKPITFTGPAEKFALNDEGMTTNDNELHHYQETGPDYVTHDTHGTGTLLGSTSLGNAHVKFDKGGTKMVPFPEIKFGGRA